MLIILIYRCVAIDMRGYGETDKPDGMKNYHTEAMIEDFRDIITFLGLAFTALYLMCLFLFTLTHKSIMFCR